ncbi:mevalonate kinase family protein [Streptomyces albipurpureus]|uniref:Galactokinase n=1 Tax=Streptomyces albipurpureus TaxID=2897419 RepID=A0ABT0UU34_9ACTN|nr:galactokinase [Streptomyces sp. CWNU-1]MCM2392097.1 galactokinase [Streptomyces sp. CWNU-1]
MKEQDIPGSTDGVRAGVPCRACLSGEDLDWLGGRSVSVALDLLTSVEIPPTGRSANPSPTSTGGWPKEVWGFLRERLPGLPASPPTVISQSDAPAASGLSSSTALIVALFRAFTDAHGPTERIADRVLTQWAYEFEFAVFNGGGMDHIAVVEGGALLLEGRPTGLPEVRERAEFPADWSVIVVDSGTVKHTGGHIRTVRAQLAAQDGDLAAYMAKADQASQDVWEALGAHDLAALGAAMNRAHEAMRDHQRMSTPLLEELRTRAARTTALPLKVSGAGGGGALVGVCSAMDTEEVVGALRRALAVDYPTARVIPTRAAPGRGESTPPRSTEST